MGCCQKKKAEPLLLIKTENITEEIKDTNETKEDNNEEQNDQTLKVKVMTKLR